MISPIRHIQSLTLRAIFGKPKRNVNKATFSDYDELGLGGCLFEDTRYLKNGLSLALSLSHFPKLQTPTLKPHILLKIIIAHAERESQHPG